MPASTTVLTVYNTALSFLGARPLVTATDAVESRRVLDALYPDVKQYALEQAVWNFAMRTAVATQAGTSATTAIGSCSVFTKPSDLVHVFHVSISQDFEPPLSTGEYLDEGASLYAATSPIYLRYTSNEATTYGGLLTRWPGTFAMYVSAALARFACVRITGGASYLGVVAKQEQELLQRAKDVDAISYGNGKLPFNQDARSLSATQMSQPDAMPFHTPRGGRARQDEE
jgi:hypothetical protein